MNRAQALVSFCGFVAVCSFIACSAKHQDHPPILTECGSNDQSCSGSGTGGAGGGGGASDGAAATDANVADTYVPIDASADTSAAANDAGLAFDSGLGLTD